MARIVDGTLVGWGDGSRIFRTTDAKVKDFRLQQDDGQALVFPAIHMQMPLTRELSAGAKGRFYLSSGKKLDDHLYGVSLAGGKRLFSADDGFDNRLVATFYLVLGIAFFWTILGIFVARTGWRIFRQMKDARAARALFDADGRSSPPI